MIERIIIYFADRGISGVAIDCLLLAAVVMIFLTVAMYFGSEYAKDAIMMIIPDDPGASRPVDGPTL